MAHPLDLSPFMPQPGSPPFPRRVLHPWMSGRPEPVSEPRERYAALLETTHAPRLAYLHVPFCAGRCLFCGFYRNRASAPAMRSYVECTIRELERDAARDGVAGRPVEAVFIGGGTPSALAAEDLHRLISAVRRCLPLTPDCEITVEGRVAGFDAEKIDACLEAGANRFSIGIQSFDTGLRRSMGRVASRDEAATFLADLVARRRAAVICDLIYGLPRQTDDIWMRDVALCDEIGLDGVDLYALTLHGDSPLARAIDKGRLPQAADDATAERRYRDGGDLLDSRGWTRVSQAHWRRTALERNRYNLATKGGADCLAFGAGGGGLLDGFRFLNEGRLDAYQADVARDEKPVAMMAAPALQHRARGAMMAALERGVLDLDRLDAAVEAGFAAALDPLFGGWSDAGLAARAGAVFELTPRGRYWHNAIADALFRLAAAYVDGGARLPPAMGHPHAVRPHS